MLKQEIYSALGRSRFLHAPGYPQGNDSTQSVSCKQKKTLVTGVPVFLSISIAVCTVLVSV